MANGNGNGNGNGHILPLEKIPYESQYPAAAEQLMREGLTSRPRQVEKSLTWAEGVDVIYTLKNMTPVKFQEFSDTLLMLAHQEAQRYKDAGLGEYYFAGFDVKLGRLSKGRDLPEEVTFQAAMHPEPEIMVWGEEALGYEVPQKFFLSNKVDDIIDIVKRYQDRVSKQTPYKVIRMFVSIRTRKPEFRPAAGRIILPGE